MAELGTTVKLRVLPEKKGRFVLANDRTLLSRDTSQSGRSSLRRVCRLTNLKKIGRVRAFHVRRPPWR